MHQRLTVSGKDEDTRGLEQAINLGFHVLRWREVTSFTINKGSLELHANENLGQPLPFPLKPQGLCTFIKLWLETAESFNGGRGPPPFHPMDNDGQEAFDSSPGWYLRCSEDTLFLNTTWIESPNPHYESYKKDILLPDHLSSGWWRGSNPVDARWIAKFATGSCNKMGY